MNQSGNWYWSSLFCTEVYRVLSQVTLADSTSEDYTVCFLHLESPSPSPSGFLESYMTCFFFLMFSFLSEALVSLSFSLSSPAVQAPPCSGCVGSLSMFLGRGVQAPSQAEVLVWTAGGPGCSPGGSGWEHRQVTGSAGGSGSLSWLWLPQKKRNTSGKAEEFQFDFGCVTPGKAI